MPRSGTGTAGRFSLVVRLAATIWFLALLGFALWTREPARREGLWRDEAISVYVARAPSLFELIRRNQISDYNPPLFNLILAGYGRLLGFEEGRLKSLAVVCGLLAIAGVTVLAYEIGGAVAASIAAALAINNPILIGVSAELRSYSLSVFLTAMALFMVLRIRAMRRTGAGTGLILLLTASLILLVYSHLAGGIVTAVLFAWGLLKWRKEPFGKGLALSALLAGCAFLPWAPTIWRQFRVGLPWERPLSLWQSFESLLRRSGDIVPIPRGLSLPLVLFGLAAVAVIAVLDSRRVVAGLWGSAGPLGLIAISGGAIWLALGLLGRQARYLAIPAALSAVVLAVLIGSVPRAFLAARPLLGSIAFAGVSALVVGSFLSRAEFYADQFPPNGLPKSGIRSLCRDYPLEAKDLVVVAPDYLAPTVWYYCGNRDDLHGFVRWDAVLFDPRDYARIWNDRSSVAATVSRIDEELRKSNQPRLKLIFDDSPNEPPLLVGLRVRSLRRELARLFDEEPIDRFPGRIESVKAVTLTRRDEKSGKLTQESAALR